MKRNKKWLVWLLVAGMFGTQIQAYQTDGYLTKEEYEKVSRGNVYEDRGIVVENYPELGYLVYRNGRNEEVVAHYYSGEMTVEKAPYYEQEDKIGYIDELFPSFNFDPRDTTIQHIWPGDNIYLRMDDEGYITYISAFNDYTVRYGKVHTWTMGADGFTSLVLEEANGKLYHYKVPKNVPISKGGAAYSLGRLKEGEWVKLLVSQKILGYGVVEESIKEIAVDPDSRVISNVYRGELLDANKYQNNITLKNNQALGKSGWSPYESIKKLSVNPKVIRSYFLGEAVSFDYVSSQLLNTGNYVYVAAENYMGKEQAVKLNFQRNKQVTLPITTVTYASPGVIQLLTGERIFLSEDTILVRDNRLVGPAGAMVGDTIQAVVSGENKLAVGRILDNTATGTIEIFRGRIREVDEYRTFEVETFSMMSEGEWYFHPTPRNFAIGPDTKLYGTEGIETNGLDTFLTHGEHSKENEVYTVIAQGDKALMIVDMPYTKEGVKGYVYQTEEGIMLKDLYTYDTQKERWRSVKGKNITAKLESFPNTVIIKDGKIVSEKAIEKGDELMIMVEKPLEVSDQQANTQVSVPSYIIMVQ